MSAEGHSLHVTVTAGADLSGCQYKVIDVAGTVSAANTAALGVLQNKPQSGEFASVAYMGHMKAYVGGTVTKGLALKVTTSGWLIAVTSGAGTVAKSLIAANSGSLCEVVGNFATGATTY